MHNAQHAKKSRPCYAKRSRYFRKIVVKQQKKKTNKNDRKTSKITCTVWVTCEKKRQHWKHEHTANTKECALNNKWIENDTLWCRLQLYSYTKKDLFIMAVPKITKKFLFVCVSVSTGRASTVTMSTRTLATLYTLLKIRLWRKHKWKQRFTIQGAQSLMLEFLTNKHAKKNDKNKQVRNLKSYARGETPKIWETQG